MIKRGVGIAHYNRLKYLPDILDAVTKTVPDDTKIVVADDGSDGDISSIIKKFKSVVLIQGENLGVAANKNRLLFALQDCTFLAILEDDLIPIKESWFNHYENACIISGIHHFCRVQDKEIPENVPEFQKFMQENGLDPIYASSPRGDLTFISSAVLSKVGGFDRSFIGAGFAHGSFSNRIIRAGLVQHPNKWIDIQQARDSFKQVGDREGGRWNLSESELKEQLDRNREVYQRIEESEEIYQPIVLQ